MSRSELSVIVAGAILLVLGLAWARYSARRRTSAEGLRAALHAPEANERIAGLMLAASDGISKNAPWLLTVARSDDDPTVLDALARIVAQHQWEPATRPEAIELRLWAREYLAGGRVAASAPPAVSSEWSALAPPEPQLEPQPEPPAPVVEEPPPSQTPARPSTPAEPAELLARAASPLAPFVPSVAPPLPPLTTPLAPPMVTPPMMAPPLVGGPQHPVGALPPQPPQFVPQLPTPPELGGFPTVLVTGAGGAAGVCVIRALKAQGVRVVAADPDDTAVGLQLADAAGLIPLADDGNFITAVCELAYAHGARALISTVAEELLVLAEGSSALAAVGLAAWLPNPNAVRTCLDKWAFAKAVAGAGIPHPPTNEGRADGVPGPWIVKPRFGRGSRDVYPINDPADLAWAIGHTPLPVVQTRLEGLEFTIDALVDRGGSLAGAVPRWRLETKAGISTKGRTFEDPQLITQTQTLVSALGLDGPLNVQGFMLSSSGLYCFTEINPRFSGGLSLSLAAGADLVGEYLRGILGQPVRRERLTYQAGVTMKRFYDEVILR